MYFMKTKDILVMHIFMFFMIVMFGDDSFLDSQDSNINININNANNEGIYTLGENDK